MGLFGGGGGFGKAFGAVAGGLGGYLGANALFGGDNRGDAMKRLLEQMQRAQAAANVKAEGYGVRGLNTMLGNYDQAINNVARTGAASRTQAIGAGQKANASLGQSLSGRGLYNTSALEGGRAQNLGATSQALANIDQAVAQAKGNLQASRGQAANAGYQGLGALAERNAQAQMMPLGLAYQAAANQPSEFDQLMQLFGGVGSLIPFMGGFKGGGTKPTGTA